MDQYLTLPALAYDAMLLSLTKSNIYPEFISDPAMFDFIASSKRGGASGVLNCRVLFNTSPSAIVETEKMVKEFIDDIHPDGEEYGELGDCQGEEWGKGGQEHLL